MLGRSLKIGYHLRDIHATWSQTNRTVFTVSNLGQRCNNCEEKAFWQGVRRGKPLQHFATRVLK